jgi:hypothetical protein
MILTKIQGGLGNQMFQWAFGRNISIKYNKELLIDRSFYNYQGEVVRHFSLNKFRLNHIEIDQNNINKFKSKSVKVLSDTNHYVNYVLSENENYFLDGYWQSEKFFLENEDIILSDFKYKSTKIENISNEIDFKNNNVISIHVRRGDYVGGGDMYPLQSISYYKNAIDLIGNYDKLLIFSDDISWCENNFNFDNMIFSRGLDNVEDLTLMSLCNHNIIANSSFSWWGAKLNKNIDKKVIAPSIWYGPKMNIETKDLVPEKWIKI